MTTRLSAPRRLQGRSFLTVCAFLGMAAAPSLAAKPQKSTTQAPTQYYIYRVALRDKQPSPYRLDRPEEWLSHASVERRLRQGLPIDSTDLPVAPRYLDQINAATMRVVGTSRWLNTALVYTADSLAAMQLEALPFVSSVKRVWTSPDSVRRPPLRLIPSKQFADIDSVEGEHYGQAAAQITTLGGHRLHALGYRGRGVTIAVLDGGFHNVDTLFTFRNTRIVAATDVVYPHSKNIFTEIDHGTKVLSTMAMNAPEVFVGTAPDASFLLLRSEDTATEQEVEEDFWAIAAEKADSLGADIITSSLSYSEFDNHVGDHTIQQLDGHTAFISRAASMVARKGMVHVNSAGNSGMGAWKKIGFPGDAPDILTVGAINGRLQNAAFSSIGPTQDGRVKPDLMAIGSLSTVVNGRGLVIGDMGTSFSTPIVAGLVACLWQALPSLSALDLIDLIRRSCSQYDHPDNIYGYGIPDFHKAYLTATRRH